jgi:hypothetical protein
VQRHFSEPALMLQLLRASAGNRWRPLQLLQRVFWDRRGLLQLLQ